jgi:hypothetical protein
MTLLFLVLSLLSKPAAVIFPVSLFCIDILRNRTLSLKLIIEKIPFFIPALLMGFLTINAQKEVGQPVRSILVLPVIFFLDFMAS